MPKQNMYILGNANQLATHVHMTLIKKLLGIIGALFNVVVDKQIKKVECHQISDSVWLISKGA